MDLVGEVAVVVFLLGGYVGAKKKIGKLDLKIIFEFFIYFFIHLIIDSILRVLEVLEDQH